MRCNEPFGGIVLVSGDLVFHVALLVASLIVIQFPKYEEWNANQMFFIDLFRWGHGISIIYRIIEWRLQKAGAYFHSFIFTQEFAKTLTTFFYFIVAVYALWGLGHYSVTDEQIKEHDFLSKIRTWLAIEIWSFILQIFSAAVFLFVNQIKGLFHLVEHHSDNRHKSDALAHYIREIQWFNLIFVTCGIHVIAIIFTCGGVNATFEASKVAYSGVMVFQRLLQFWFLMPLKTGDGKFKEVDKKVWLMFAAFQVIGICIALSWTAYQGVTTATAIVEFIVITGQFIYSTVNVQIQKASEVTEEGQSESAIEQEKDQNADVLKYLSKSKNEFVLEDSIYSFAIYAMIHPNVIESWPKAGGYAIGIKLSQNDRESVFQGAVALAIIQVAMLTLVLTEMFGDGWTIVPPNKFFLMAPRFIMAFFMHATLQGEIKAGLRIMKYVVYHPYSFRKFDPEIHDKEDEKEAKEHMKEMAKEEVVQANINEDKEEAESSSSDEEEETKKNDDFQRVASKNDGLYLRVIYAFTLGFIQCAMGFLLEFMSVIYLSSKPTFQLILVSYATMACLGNFDSLYSQSLQEHPCRGIIGKKICTVWRRSMSKHKDEMIRAIRDEQMKREDAVATDREVAGEPDEMAKEKKKEDIQENYELNEAILQYLENESPNDHCLFVLLRTVTKIFRLFYVSFFFYFAPFYLLLYNFYLEQRHQWELREKQDIHL